MRIVITYLLLAILAASCASPSHERVLSDSKAQRLLIGNWTEVSRPILKENITTLRTDGTFVSNGTLAANGRAITVKFEGRWHVQNGVLISEITESSAPFIILVGRISHDTIITLAKTEYRYRDDEGKEEKWLRLQPDLD
jgi:hypothetical protein